MGHAARVGKRQNNTQLCYGGLKKEDFLTSCMHKWDLIILKLVLKEYVRFMCPGYESVAALVYTIMNTRFQVLTDVLLKIQVLWDVILCRFVKFPEGLK